MVASSFLNGKSHSVINDFYHGASTASPLSPVGLKINGDVISVRKRFNASHHVEPDPNRGSCAKSNQGNVSDTNLTNGTNIQRRDSQDSGPIPASNYCIGRKELAAYYAVWIAHVLAAAVIAARLSYGDAGRWVEHWMSSSDYAAGYRMDDSDLEWKLFRKTAAETVAVFIIHSVTFRLATRYLPLRASSLVLVTLWISLHFYLTSVKCMLFLAAFVSVTTSLVVLTRRKSIAWLICGAIMINVNRWAPFSPHAAVYYREFSLYLYTCVQVISYCAHLAQHKPRNERYSFWEMIDFLEYLFYPMYSTALIVLYDDFRAQITRARAALRSDTSDPSTPTMREIIWRATRLVFWFYFMNCVLHFWRVNAFYNSPFSFLNGLNNYELVSVSYLVGQLFHVKYTIIFGIPRLFAQIDGLSPPGAPICISRVSKYSQMWRHFDQGLYAFLKEQVYVPIIGDSNPKNKDLRWRDKALHYGRKAVSTAMVFLFVLGWHGVASNYVCWIISSGVELTMERLGHCISRRPTTQRLKNQIGPGNWTRLAAVCMLATAVPGIFGIFYFLGGAGVGHTVFRRIVLSGTWDILTLNVHFMNAGFVLLHIYALGYCFNHVCMHLDSLFKARKKAH